MNTEDTKEEGGYKVCIQCYNLFNPSKQPPPLYSRGPGGAAAPSPPFRLSSPRSPSRSSSPGAAPVTSSLRSPRRSPIRSLSPSSSSQGAAAVSPSPQRLSPPRSSLPPIELPPRMTDAQRRLQKLIDEGL